MCLSELGFRTTTRVPCPLAPANHCCSQSPRVTCEGRVGGRAGTAAPKGTVCELPHPPIPPACPCSQVARGRNALWRVRSHPSSLCPSAETESAPHLHPNDAPQRKTNGISSEISAVGTKPLVHNGRMERQVNDVSDSRGLVWAIVLAVAILVPFIADSAEVAAPEPTELRANTLAALDRYVKLTEARNEEELKRGTNLLWIDELPPPEGAEAYA